MDTKDVFLHKIIPSFFEGVSQGLLIATVAFIVLAFLK